MGGFFSSTPAVTTTTATLPATPDPDAEARKLRLENMERNRRGRAGLVATSDRGILSQANATTGTKQLLGE